MTLCEWCLEDKKPAEFVVLAEKKIYNRCVACRSDKPSPQKRKYHPNTKFVSGWRSTSRRFSKENNRRVLTGK